MATKVAWNKKVSEVRMARKTITELRLNGRGMDLDGSRGTFWGVLNAITEFVDHHQELSSIIIRSSRGRGLAMRCSGTACITKQKAFELLQRELKKAA